ncbi:MAG: hypothetical protein HQK63_04075 [Desulfamplus sp.]|nr:hypothetical protein [Desulfamplus sp.]
MIPKFDVYHTELHSSYIYFEKYRLFLQSQRFSGYVQLENGQKQYLFFLKEGKDVGYLKIVDHKLKLFDLSEIELILKNSFSVSSYRSPHQIVDFFARCHATQLILDNLFFDSVEFDKFFNQIESKKITGFLQASKSGEPERYIYLYSGKIFGYMNIKGKDGLFEKNLDKNQIQVALKNSTVKVYSIPPSSDIAKRRSTSDSDSGNNQLDNIKTTHNQNITDKSNNDENRLSIIECYEKIFQLLEKNTESVEFTSIWRMCALELSNKYIFLNPFAGEFNYDNSKIDLWEKIDLKIATNALDELINAIAKKANLPKDGIKAIKDNYLTILAAYEIRS